MIKVLLVEDETDFGETAKDILELGIGGYQVTLATNGEDGLEKFKQFSPDVIVTDVDMPYMDRLKMVDYIRKEDTNIPILFVSGLQTANDVIKGYEVGANNYIKKYWCPLKVTSIVPMCPQYNQTNIVDTFSKSKPLNQKA